MVLPRRAQAPGDVDRSDVRIFEHLARQLEADPVDESLEGHSLVSQAPLNRAQAHVRDLSRDSQTGVPDVLESVPDHDGQRIAELSRFEPCSGRDRQSASALRGRPGAGRPGARPGSYGAVFGDSLSRSGYINRSFGGPSATGGVDHKLRSHDFLAGSFNWTRPTGDGMRDQYTAEVFYRFYFSERLAFTPDVQWVISPALNPDASSIWLFGIRARIEF